MDAWRALGEQLRKDCEKERKKKLKRKKERWAAFRDRYLKRYCESCGSHTNLCLHHLNYSDYYNPTTVITLCSRCHFIVHNYDEDYWLY